MKLITLMSLMCLLITVYHVDAVHFLIGNIADRVMLANHSRVEYNAIPFVKRVKQFFWTGPDNKKIQGIQALDQLYSKATINVTAGGIGHSFVNMRMKSERGRGLSYDIGIYVNPDFF